MIQTEDDKRAYLKRRDVALEKIENALNTAWPGTKAEEKQNKLLAANFAFGTGDSKISSWTEMSGMNPKILEDGFEKLQAFIKEKTHVVAAPNE